MYVRGTVFWISRSNFVIGSFNAISGKHGNGALPPGYYRGANYRPWREEQGFVCNRRSSGQFGYSLALEARFSSDPLRLNVALHPDEVPSLGTLGCIGIDCADAGRFQLFLDDYFITRKNKRIPVWVDWR